MKEALAHFPMPWLACVAMLLFLGVFCGVLVRVLRPAHRAHFDALAEIPFKEET